MYESENASDLIRDLNKGRPEAIEYIGDLFYASLAFFANKYVVDQEAAKKIANEALGQLLFEKEELETFMEVKAFLYITTRNLCLKQLGEESKIAVKPEEDEVFIANAMRAEIIRKLDHDKLL